MEAQTEGMGAVKLATEIETTFADVAGSLRTALMDAMSGIDNDLTNIAKAINLGGEDFIGFTGGLTEKAKQFLQQNTTDIQKSRLELIEKTQGEQGDTLQDTMFEPLNATVSQMLNALEGNNEELLGKMLDNNGEFTTELDNFIKETSVAVPDDFRGECLLQSEELFMKNIFSTQKLVARTSGLYNKGSTSNIANWGNHFDGQKITLPNKTMNRICRDTVSKFMLNSIL